MHVLKIYESYLPVLFQYITGSDVILLSINTVTAIVVIHISFHMYNVMYILHAASDSGNKQASKQEMKEMFEASS